VNDMKAEAKAKPASTVMLLRDGRSGLEVFMVVRHHQVDFASGALVFPGGRMEQSDVELAQSAARWPESPNLDVVARSLRVAAIRDSFAAIRDSFEECGILLARPDGAADLISGDRLRTIDRRAPFAEILRRENLVLAIDLLVPFAHWITPPFMPKRFDTHFFVTPAPRDQVVAHDGRETVDSMWISPQMALEEGKRGRFTLVFATERNLWKLARFSDCASTMAAAQADPIVTVMPKRVAAGQGYSLKIPPAAGYGGELFPIRRTPQST
jgi:8-oxo-dGTP pyrophosphatase MutT (NUDIX family)